MALGKSLREVEAMDCLELAWWRAFYEVDPWGDQRADLRNAMLLQAVMGIFGKAPDLASLMPFSDRQVRQQSAEEMSAILTSVFRRLPKVKA